MKRTLFFALAFVLACSSPKLPDPEVLLRDNASVMHLSATATFEGVDDKPFELQLIDDAVDLHLLENGYAVIEWEGNEDNEVSYSSAKWEKVGQEITITLDGVEVHFEQAALRSASDSTSNVVNGYSWKSSTAPSVLDNLSFFDEEMLNQSMGSGLSKSND
ncbi:MAG: hypothetical protein GC193_07535 [Cryomorphaceae bacterium]|nr:hypothetical protein [Cryomorphaceae bacterium]